MTPPSHRRIAPGLGRLSVDCDHCNGTRVCHACKGVGCSWCYSTGNCPWCSRRAPFRNHRKALRSVSLTAGGPWRQPAEIEVTSPLSSPISQPWPPLRSRAWLLRARGFRSAPQPYHGPERQRRLWPFRRLRWISEPTRYLFWPWASPQPLRSSGPPVTGDHCKDRRTAHQADHTSRNRKIIVANSQSGSCDVTTL